MKRIALLAIPTLALLAGCGEGGTPTVVSTTTSSTTAAATTEDEGGLTPIGGVSLQEVQACLNEAGADMDDPKTAGPGMGLFGIMPQGTYAGVAVAPNARVAQMVGQRFSRDPAFEVNTVDDPNVLVMFKGTVDDADRATMESCVAPSG